MHQTPAVPPGWLQTIPSFDEVHFDISPNAMQQVMSGGLIEPGMVGYETSLSGEQPKGHRRAKSDPIPDLRTMLSGASFSSGSMDTGDDLLMANVERVDSADSVGRPFRSSNLPPGQATTSLHDVSADSLGSCSPGTASPTSSVSSTTSGAAAATPTHGKPNHRKRPAHHRSRSEPSWDTTPAQLSGAPLGVSVPVMGPASGVPRSVYHEVSCDDGSGGGAASFPINSHAHLSINTSASTVPSVTAAPVAAGHALAQADPAIASHLTTSVRSPSASHRISHMIPRPPPLSPDNRQPLQKYFRSSAASPVSARATKHKRTHSEPMPGPAIEEELLATNGSFNASGSFDHEMFDKVVSMPSAEWATLTDQDQLNGLPSLRTLMSVSKSSSFNLSIGSFDSTVSLSDMRSAEALSDLAAGGGAAGQHERASAAAAAKAGFPIDMADASGSAPRVVSTVPSSGMSVAAAAAGVASPCSLMTEIKTEAVDEHRGKYRCGRCGQFKVNHVCTYVVDAACRNVSVQANPADGAPRFDKTIRVRKDHPWSHADRAATSPHPARDARQYAPERVLIPRMPNRNNAAKPVRKPAGPRGTPAPTGVAHQPPHPQGPRPVPGVQSTPVSLAAQQPLKRQHLSRQQAAALQPQLHPVQLPPGAANMSMRFASSLHPAATFGPDKAGGMSVLPNSFVAKPNARRTGSAPPAPHGSEDGAPVFGDMWPPPPALMEQLRLQQMQLMLFQQQMHQQQQQLIQQQHKQQQHKQQQHKPQQPNAAQGARQDDATKTKLQQMQQDPADKDPASPAPSPPPRQDGGPDAPVAL